MLQMSKNMEK